jgi:hypothetical protein
MEFTRPGQSLPAAAGGDRGGHSIGRVSEFLHGVIFEGGSDLSFCL